MWAVASWVWCFTSTAARRSSLGAIQICDPGSYMDWKHQKTNGIQWVLELVNFAIQQNSSAADCNFPVQVDNLYMDSANVLLHLQEPVAFALRQFEIEMHGLFMLVDSIIYSHGLSMSIQVLPFHDLVDTLWGVAQAQLVLGCVQDLRGAVKRAQRKGIDEVVWKDGTHGGSVKTEWLVGWRKKDQESRESGQFWYALFWNHSKSCVSLKKALAVLDSSRAWIICSSRVESGAPNSSRSSCNVPGMSAKLHH